MEDWEGYVYRDEFFEIYIVSSIIFIYDFSIGSEMNIDYKYK